MKYMTTSKCVLQIGENGLKELDHVCGAGHHHYLVEAESEEKLAPLKAFGASWQEVLHEEYVKHCLENHTMAGNLESHWFMDREECIRIAGRCAENGAPIYFDPTKPYGFGIDFERWRSRTAYALAEKSELETRCRSQAWVVAVLAILNVVLAGIVVYLLR